MALLSRSSLRGSLRRSPDHSDDGLPAPNKLRTQENGSHHRRSSPDCLDTSIPVHRVGPGKARLANPPLKSSRPRTSTRRTRRSSSASVVSVASSTQLNTPRNPRASGNGVFDDPRQHPDQNTPSGAISVDHLRERESPDPLDTISPAVNRTKARSGSSPAPKPEPKPADSPVATRTTRRNDPEPKTDEAHTANEQHKNPEQLSSTRPADATRSLRTRQSDPVKSEQTAPAQPGSERRSLRSADTGSRCKSELAPYFYNYEQLISLEAPKPELLAAGTTIVLVDDLPEPLRPPPPDPMPFGNPLQNLHHCEVITLPEPVLRSAAVDPLSDELYFRAHRKFERQEKQLRNIERDRAQHEKQNVDRLLEELRGQDWLRVMGLTGVHESERKLYEPKRQILIQELVAVVKKFQVWKDEERRRKLGKDKPLPSADAEAGPRRRRERSRPAEDPADVDGSPISGVDTPSTPDPNDVDAWAARQLHQEARSASAAKPRKSASGNHKARAEQDEPLQSKETQDSSKRQKTQHSHSLAPSVFYYEPPDKPFTSLFGDRQARDMAIAAAAGPRPGQNADVLAFGHSIPDVEEHDFEPPPELLTEEYIQASRRQRRRLKRQSQG